MSDVLTKEQNASLEALSKREHWTTSNQWWVVDLVRRLVGRVEELERAAKKRLNRGCNDTCSHSLNTKYACDCGDAELAAALSNTTPKVVTLKKSGFFAGLTVRPNLDTEAPVPETGACPHCGSKDCKQAGYDRPSASMCGVRRTVPAPEASKACQGSHLWEYRCADCGATCDDPEERPATKKSADE